MEARPALAAVWASNARSRQTPRVEQREPLLGDALGVEADREPAGSRPSSAIETSGEATRLPASQNERSSWTASAEKPR